jgi:hypothetical protein
MNILEEFVDPEEYVGVGGNIIHICCEISNSILIG